MKPFIAVFFMSLQTFAAIDMTEELMIHNEKIHCFVDQELRQDEKGHASKIDRPKAMVTSQTVLGRLLDPSSKPFQDLNQVDILVSKNDISCHTIRKIQKSAWMNFGFLPATVRLEQQDPLMVLENQCISNVKVTLILKPRDSKLPKVVLMGENNITVPCTGSETNSSAQ